MAAALAPVVGALRAEAQAQATAILTAADAAAREATTHAQTQATAVLAQARTDGEAAAERTANIALGATRRDARGVVLAAQRRVHDAVRAGTLAELARRWTTSEAAALAGRLADIARARLGPTATIRSVHDARIGVVADAGNRHLELTTELLVDRALSEFGPRINALWA
jgi:vacuolar-type H+-ATPase subunit E/Vma4